MMGQMARINLIALTLVVTSVILTTPSYASKMHYIHWNTSNPIFRIDNTDHIIDVNKNNFQYDYDQVNIVCPTYDPSTREEDAEKYIIYNVSKEEYDTCHITTQHPRVIAVCNKPYDLMYITITFRPFSPQPNGLEFKPGQDYYFISTSSSDDLERRIGGRCSSHHMKVVFKVCCDPDKPKPGKPQGDQGGVQSPIAGSVEGGSHHHLHNLPGGIVPHNSTDDKYAPAVPSSTMKRTSTASPLTPRRRTTPPRYFGTTTPRWRRPSYQQPGGVSDYGDYHYRREKPYSPKSNGKGQKYKPQHEPDEAKNEALNGSNDQLTLSSICLVVTCLLALSALNNSVQCPKTEYRNHRKRTREPTAESPKEGVVSDEIEDQVETNANTDIFTGLSNLSKCCGIDHPPPVNSICSNLYLQKCLNYWKGRSKPPLTASQHIALGSVSSCH